MKKTDDTPEFQAFWAIWRPRARHTDGRGLARETFNKHVAAGAIAQDIIDGARCFFRTMKDKDREFVPLSSTWINRGSFEDLAEIERAYQAKYGQPTGNVVQMQPTREQHIAAELRRADRSWK